MRLWDGQSRFLKDFRGDSTLAPQDTVGSRVSFDFSLPQMVTVTPYFQSGVSGLVHNEWVCYMLWIQMLAAGIFMSPPCIVTFSHSHEIQLMLMTMMSGKKHGGKV